MSRRTRRRRAEARYGPEVGTTYLLHFVNPATGQAARYQHAGHYIGWTTDLAARLEAHASGTGARLVEVITRAGLGFTLARTWPQTTRDREDLLKHIGDARRFCPECGVTPRQGPAVVMPERRQPVDEPDRGSARLAGTLPAARAPDGREYEFEDWPELTAGHTAAEAAELTDLLRRGRETAYRAAAATGARTGPASAYIAAFDTALEVDLACQKAGRETLQFHGREPHESVDEWIDRIRQETPRQPQEDHMFRRRAAQARQQLEADQQQQAEADRLFALADELERQAGERPDYRREITRERAARIVRQLAEPLPRDTVVTEPQIACLHPDPDVARRPGPEFRDSAGTMDADRTAQALGRRREDVEAAVREQAARETQLGGWARREAARPAAGGSTELADTELDAEIDRLAEMFPDPSPVKQGAAAAPDYYRSAPGRAEHRTAYRDMFAAASGTGFAHPDADLSYEIDNAEELAAERYYDDLAERHYSELDGPEAEQTQPGPDATRWVPGQDRDDAREMAGEHLGEHAARAADAWRQERRATADEHLAQLAHDEQALGSARQDAQRARAARESATRGAHVAAADMQRSAPGPDLDDPGRRFPLPRVLDPSQASPVRAPVAATLADGTPHADPLLAERGWQAQGGVYVRQPHAQLEAG
jgi:hypothetical protein